MPSSSLTEAQVQIIKQRLWNGETASAVCGDYGVSIFCIGNLAAGHRWKNAPWPDGSLGAMPKKRRDEIGKARREVQLDSQERVKKKLNKS